MTTVLSMNAMLEPRIVAVRIHGLVPSPHGTSLPPDRSTASSQGALMDTMDAIKDALGPKNRSGTCCQQSLATLSIRPEVGFFWEISQSSLRKLLSGHGNTKVSHDLIWPTLRAMEISSLARQRRTLPARVLHRYEDFLLYYISQRVTRSAVCTVMIRLDPF